MLEAGVESRVISEAQSIDDELSGDSGDSSCPGYPPCSTLYPLILE